MKLIMKGIEAIVWFDEEDDISPIKFKIKGEQSEQDTIIVVGKIIKKVKRAVCWKYNDCFRVPVSNF